MKRAILCGLLVSLSLPLLAQEPQDITMESSLRKWGEKPLTMEDLSYRTGASSEGAMKLSYSIRWDYDKHKMGNTKFVYPTFTAYMNPYDSWIKPNFRNDNSLRLMQTCFDYVELCKRRAQKEVNQNNHNTPNSIVKFHMNVADGFFEKMLEDTQYGKDTLALRTFEERVAAELESENSGAFVPDYKIYPRGNAMGMHLGFGAEIPSGGVARYIGPLYGLDFGFDFCWNRWMVYWDGLLGFGTDLKRDLSYGAIDWQAGHAMTGGNINLAGGYVAYDSQWWKVTPLAGIGVDFIDYPERERTQTKTEIAAFRILAGVSTDFKFSRMVASDALSEWSVRARVYAAYNTYSEPVGSSWSINFGLGVNWLGWFLK